MRRLVFFIFLLFIFLSFKSDVFAEKIDSFDTNVVAHKDGTMSVTESINYDFESLQRHGIYRYIPLYTNVGNLYRIININNVTVTRDGQKEQFDKSANKSQIYLKIGNPDKTISGTHDYVITYNVANGIGSNFPDYDEIYWNGTGNEWEVKIEKASVKITNDFDISATKYLCFTGVAGSKRSDCDISDNVISSTNVLNPSEGLTAVAVFPKGTYPPSVLSKSPPQTLADQIFGLIIDNILYIWLFLNVILVGIIVFWYQKYKNKKRYGKPAVNFDIPKDMKGDRISPALAGVIDTAKLERDDVVATLFDLAIRRYIKLEEIKKERKMLPDEKDQKITKLKDSAGLDSFEKILYNKLFEDDGDFVLIKDLKKDFYKTFQSLEVNVFSTLKSKKYFVKNPKAQRGFLFVLGVIAFLTTNIILGVVLIFLSRKLIGRTALGDEIDFKIDGLKLFLKSMDRNYTWQTEKFYTVEAMIPYAMSLGYIDKFMEQLKIIKPDYDPYWYGGNRGNFYLAYGAFYSSINSNITTASPSSSGSGGGGFSGGGGGGGGGGSW